MARRKRHPAVVASPVQDALPRRIPRRRAAREAEVIPVNQNHFGHRDGNCFSACIASLLELPLEAVPTFYIYGEPDDIWTLRLDRFLEPFGLYGLHFIVDPPVYEPVREGLYRLHSSKTPGRPLTVPPGVLHIRAGMSPRGHSHAVLARGHEVVHDPSPLKTGLLSVEGFSLLLPRFE